MKYLALLFLGLILCPLFPQNGEVEEETLLSGDIEHGGYGGPTISFTYFNGDFAIMNGGRGAWIINKTFSIGGGGFGLITSHNIEWEAPPGLNPDTDMEIYFDWGGPCFEYIFNSHKALHYTLNLMIGWGSLSYNIDEGDQAIPLNVESKYEGSDGVFVINPGVSAEFNITSFFRINLGGSYRLVSGIEDVFLTESDVNANGFSLDIMFKFGGF